MSICVVGASLGEMVIPLAVANLFEAVGPRSLLVVLFACNLSGMVTFALILIVGKRTKKQMAGKTYSSREALLPEKTPSCWGRVPHGCLWKQTNLRVLRGCTVQ